MIGLFRKFRFKLFGENKLSKYLFYAIGEILITVIGILIAIQVNNWNQNRLEVIRINHLLIEIKNNLSIEIRDAERHIKFYNQRDSIIKRVINKTVTRDDFANPNHELLNPQFAIMTYRFLSRNRNAYENLISNSDKIPIMYRTLFEELTLLYVNIDRLLTDRETKLLEKIYPHQEYLRKNKDWWSKFFTMEELDENAIDYFMYDPIYLNWVYEYQNDAISLRNAIKKYQAKALQINKSISALELEHDL